MAARPLGGAGRPLAALLLLCARPARAVQPVPVGACGSADFFDIDSLLCTGCPSGQRPAPSGHACECANDTVAVSAAAAFEAGSGEDAHCVACGGGLVPARAYAHAALGGSCMACGLDAAGSANVTLDTAAGTQAVLINGTTAVPNGTVVDANGDNFTTYEVVDATFSANVSVSTSAVGNVSVSCPAGTTEPTLGQCAGLAEPDGRCLGADDAAFAECACPDGYVVVETGAAGALLPSKRCELCAPHAYPSATSPGLCEPCADERMVFKDGACACPGGWVRQAHAPGLWGRDETCVLSAAREQVLALVDADLASRITYTSVLPATSASGLATTETVDSATLAQLLVPSAAECFAVATTGRPDPAHGGRSPCQALANLCVLADYADDAPACLLYRRAQDLSPPGSTHGEPQWRARMPWLYYGGDAPSALRDAGLALRVAVAPSSSSSASAGGGLPSVLSLVLNSYSLNGTWLGLTNLTNQLQLCGGSTAQLGRWQEVGVAVTTACDVSVTTDLAALSAHLGNGPPPGTPTSGAASLPASFSPSREAVLRGAFHELYIRDADGALFPVPVRVRNFPTGANAQPAAQPASLEIPEAVDPDAADDVLTRRFFLVDALSGRKQGAAAGAPPDVVRYARAVSLSLRVSEADPAKVLPPLLTVEYAEALTAGGSRGAGSVPASFEASYSMELEQYWNSVSILLVFACLLLLACWLLACLAWVRRNQRVVLDADFAVAALLHALGLYADIFAIVVAGLCAHWYLFYKAQDRAYIMLPAESQVGPIVLMLGLALAGKAAQVLGMVWRQSHADVFLIDWESAHGTLLGKEGAPEAEAPVSVWRTIFVANELNELQAARLTRPSLSLVLVLTFMLGLDFERFARAVPGSADGDVSGVASHVLLRTAVSSFVWALVLGGQALLLRFLYVPYVEDKVGQLVDLLALANVSVLMLPEPLCGYYLHGRSVHAHADGSMLELNRQLRAEEDGLTSERGLSPASQLQTFEVHLTPALRQLYDSTFLHAALQEAADNANGADAHVRRQAASGSNQMSVPLAGGVSIERARRAGDGFRSNPEGAVARYVQMNALLRDFVAGTLDGHSYSIREKSYLERLLRLPPDMSYARESLFLFDSSGSWTRALLYGREYDLALLEVLVYTVTDMSLRSSLVSAVVTYLVWLAVEQLRATLGQRNLARKTLIDGRFLI